MVIMQFKLVAAVRMSKPTITSIIDFAMVGRKNFPFPSHMLAGSTIGHDHYVDLPCIKWSWKDYEIFLYSSSLTAVHCLPSIRKFHNTASWLQYCFLCSTSFELLLLLALLFSLPLSLLSFSLPFPSLSFTRSSSLSLPPSLSSLSLPLLSSFQSMYHCAL